MLGGMKGHRSSLTSCQTSSMLNMSKSKIQRRLSSWTALNSPLILTAVSAGILPTNCSASAIAMSTSPFRSWISLFVQNQGQNRFHIAIAHCCFATFQEFQRTRLRDICSNRHFCRADIWRLSQHIVHLVS